MRCLIMSITYRHSELDGFPTVWRDLKAGINDRDAVNHMIKYVKNNPTEFNDISAFEFQYADKYLNRADVMVGNIKYEFKSWQPGTANPWNSFFSGSGDSYTQFTRYLANSNSLAELKYIFNGSKASETVVKNAFKDLFVDKKVEIFQTMPSQLRESILGSGNANRFDLFEQAINNTESNLYKFIKSE